MDELAYSMGADPVALRLLNDTLVDPYTGRPFSTRAMRRCLTEGAQRFGWNARNPVARSMRDGRYLIGQGVAGAIYRSLEMAFKNACHAEERRLGARRIGHAGDRLRHLHRHETSSGRCSRTPHRQGRCALGRHTPARISLGDQLQPPCPNAGGGVLPGRERRAGPGDCAGSHGPRCALRRCRGEGCAPGKWGTRPAATRAITYSDLLARNRLSVLIGDGNYDPVAEGPTSIFSFSALFAEVQIDEELGLVRLRRFVGAYDAGRIINPRTARSQAIGGIIWGVGQALLEQSETDPVMGRFLLRNYSGYLVPTNADIRVGGNLRGRVRSRGKPTGYQGNGRVDGRRGSTCDRQRRLSCDVAALSRDLPVTVEKLL